MGMRRHQKQLQKSTGRLSYVTYVKGPSPTPASRRYCSCWLSGGAPGWLAGLEGGIAAGCSPATAAADAIGPEAALLAADCERLPSISELDTSPDCRLLVGDMPA